jgi:pimeloyl-ACP methyl ester carboxylesterase
MEDPVARSPRGATAGRTTAGLAWDEAGSGQPVVLVHAGVADRRMWDPLMAPLAAGHRVIRYDARGFGETLPPVGPWAHHADLLGLVDELRLERPHLVAASMGAGIAVEAALARPPAIASLVLAAPGGALFAEPPDALRALWRDEVAALDRGDVDGAVEINLRAWVDGPSRQPGEVDPEVRAFVGRMQREAFELPEWDPDEAPESELDPPASGRFAEIRRPLTVVVGELDQAACVATAERLGGEVPGATVVRWADVAHMLTLERPDDFAELVLDALAAPA